MLLSKVAREGKWLKILTKNKLLPRCPILIAQIKTGKNLSKLKMKLTNCVVHHSV